MSTRAQSTVIGVVLLFGIAIIAFSSYQAYQVPNQNANVEFQHFQAVQDDMIALRSGILQTGQTDEPQFRTLRLGTQYPTRIAAVNPPPPAGRLHTTPAYNITIANATTSQTVPTRFLVYEPGYTHLTQTPIWYENTLVYLDGRATGEGVVILADQAINRTDDLRVIALQNTLDRSGTNQISIALYATRAVGSLPTGSVTVQFPTRLDPTAGEYPWNETLGAYYAGVTQNAYADGVHQITLTNLPREELAVNTVGLNELPTAREAPFRDRTAPPGDRDPPPAPTPPTPSLSLRVEDFTDWDRDRPAFYVSYAGSQAVATVEVTVQSQQSNRVQTQTGPARSGRLFSFQTGRDETFQITAQARGSDGTLLTERTITTTADGTSPTQANDPFEALRTADDATLEGVTIVDQTNFGQGARYDVSYTVSQSGDFSTVEGFALSLASDPGQGSTRTTSQRRVDSLRLNPYNGFFRSYRVGVIVTDSQGVAVDGQAVIDTADSADP